MDKQTVQKAVDKLTDVATLPTVIHKIIEIVNSPNTSASDLNKAISMDQALCAKILKLVNSAFYGFPQRIETLTQAIVILGFHAVRNLALSISIFDEMSGKTRRCHIDYQGFWRHSIGVSVMARALAKKSYPSLAEEAFVAGLIHDIGVMMLDQLFPTEYSEVVQVMRDEKITIYEAEKRVIRVTHCDVGHMLAVKWSLPGTLDSAVSKHHEPSPADDYFTITALIHAANVGAKILNLGDPGDARFILKQHIQDDVRRALQLEPEFPLYYRDLAEKALKESEDFFGSLQK